MITVQLHAAAVSSWTMRKYERLIMAEKFVELGQLTARQAAKRFDVPLSTLYARMRKRSPRLTAVDEVELMCQRSLLILKGFTITFELVSRLLNRILAARGAAPFSEHEIIEFVMRNPTLKEDLEKCCKYLSTFVRDPTLLGTWFYIYTHHCIKHNIKLANIYSMDEIFFAMGAISPHLAVPNVRLIQPDVREWATAMLCISAGGESLPPFIVFENSEDAEKQHALNAPEGWTVETLSAKRTYNDIIVSWIKHFDRLTAERAQGQPRLLILDDHESHVPFDLIEYAEEHDIHVLATPPLTSHITQPIEARVFQPLELAYTREARRMLHSGITRVNQTSFLEMFQKAYPAVMSKSLAQLAFCDTGLVPLDPGKIATHCAPEDPRRLELLDEGLRVRGADSVAVRVKRLAFLAQHKPEAIEESEDDLSDMLMNFEKEAENVPEIHDDVEALKHSLKRLITDRKQMKKTATAKQPARQPTKRKRFWQEGQQCREPHGASKRRSKYNEIGCTRRTCREAAPSGPHLVGADDDEDPDATLVGSHDMKQPSA